MVRMGRKRWTILVVLQRARAACFAAGAGALGGGFCRSAFRFSIGPGIRIIILGLRVARVPADKWNTSAEQDKIPSPAPTNVGTGRNHKARRVW